MKPIKPESLALPPITDTIDPPPSQFSQTQKQRKPIMNDIKVLSYESKNYNHKQVKMWVTSA